MKKVKENSKEVNRSNTIESVYLESKNWNIVLRSNDYVNQAGSKEDLVDYVGKLYKTKIRTAKQLQGLMKVNEDLFDEVDYAFTVSNYNKYLAALKSAIENGKKYEDLLKISPSKFNLPETWYGCVSTDQYTTILTAIGNQFHLKNGELLELPSLRKMSEELKAPYSVLMDAFEYANPIIEKF